MNAPSVSRRQVLGTVALSATAGCTAFGSKSGIRVGNIIIGNWKNEPVTITVRLDREGSTVFQEALEIEGDDEALVEQSWDGGLAEYTVMFSTEGEGRITSLSLPDEMRGANGECIDIQIHCQQSMTDIVFRDDSPLGGGAEHGCYVSSYTQQMGNPAWHMYCSYSRRPRQLMFRRTK
ncbi:hypothetical protein [Natronosalvus rutilus]|uniref:Uncharacterized protein n=1 Tax=Natronosalvus rutilus TaxID=2953753 RepID=A0A9E7N641_9EURY|nr:hypothetical protein [Natronosalvus rutilus]UTF52427.1 hypothetical protein NGM29_11570 [Natronosalvus rutilus]